MLSAKAERLAVKRELTQIRSARSQRADEQARAERARVAVRQFVQPRFVVFLCWKLLCMFCAWVYC